MKALKKTIYLNLKSNYELVQKMNVKCTTVNKNA